VKILTGKVAAIVAVAAVGAVAVSVAAASLQPSGGDGGGLGAAIRATAKYQSASTATRAGYSLLRDKDGVACIAMPGTGAMGVHFVRSSLVADPAIAAKTPEALVYEPVGERKLRLAAVEYVVLQKAWDAKHPSAPKLFGQQFMLTPDGNRFGLPAFYSLHAWIWKANQDGTFAMWNPGVTCR
jgi:hypothetical protein